MDGSFCFCERSSVVGVPCGEVGNSSACIVSWMGLDGVFGLSSAAAVVIFPSSTRQCTTSGVVGGCSGFILLCGLGLSVCKQKMDSLRGWYGGGMIGACIQGQLVIVDRDRIRYGMRTVVSYGQNVQPPYC